MNPIVISGTIIVHLALICYGIGIVNEQIRHRVTRFVLVFLALGLLFDLVATVCMIVGTGRGLITKHSLLGFSCLLAMAVDSILVLRHYLKYGTQPVPRILHLYSRYAYIWWVAGAYVTGGLLAFLSISTRLLGE